MADSDRRRSGGFADPDVLSRRVSGPCGLKVTRAVKLILGGAEQFRVTKGTQAQRSLGFLVVASARLLILAAGVSGDGLPPGMAYWA